jgi:hypothetical protein
MSSSKVKDVEVIDLTNSDNDDDDEPKMTTKAPPTATAASKKNKKKAPPPPAAASSSTAADPRRSQRESKTTIIYIDGHAIKRTNNYTVTGMQYIHDDNSQYDTVSPTLKRRAKLQEAYAQKKAKMTTIAPRKVSPQEVARQAHNQAVQCSKAAKQDLRRAFLQDHARTLRPFLEDAVYQGLLQRDEVEVTYETLPAVEQPKLVTGGALRDYQKEGLTFLVNHHRRNCGMILGDEMGLGM